MDIVEDFRKVIQDLIVPESKAVQVEVRNLNERIGKLDERFEALHKEMNGRFEAVNSRFETMHREISERFETMYKEIEKRFNELKETQIKILELLNIEPRISKLEVYYEEIKERLDRISPLLIKEKGVEYKTKK